MIRKVVKFLLTPYNNAHYRGFCEGYRRAVEDACLWSADTPPQTVFIKVPRLR